jgi:hypothetical protein
MINELKKLSRKEVGDGKTDSNYHHSTKKLSMFFIFDVFFNENVGKWIQKTM